MSIELTYRCVCGVVKQTSNHWFVAFTDKLGMIKIVKWSITAANRKEAIHICGRECGNKLLSQWMGDAS